MKDEVGVRLGGELRLRFDNMVVRGEWWVGVVIVVIVGIIEVFEVGWSMMRRYGVLVVYVG